MDHTANSRAFAAGLVVLIALFTAVNGFYFLRSQTPTFWDDSSYLKGSLDLYDALNQKGVPGFVATFSHLYTNKAPLICVFPVPLYVAFGREFDPRFLVGIGFLILMSVYLYRLGEGLWSPKEGLLAVAIVQTMPLFYGLSRQYLVDYGLATLVTIWVYYLFCAPITSKVGVLMGILLGAGMLMKVTFPLYVGAPTIAVVWALLRDAPDNRERLSLVRRLGCILLIGGSISGIWYAPNLKSVFGFAISAGYGTISVNYGNTAVLSGAVLLQYFIVLIVCALSSYYFLLLIALFPIWALASRSRNRLKRPGGTVGLFLWALLPLVTTTLAVNKDPRYTAPILPVVGLCLAHMIIGIFDRGRLLAATAVVLLMIVPVFAYATASLPMQGRIRDFKLGPFVFWSPRLAWYASAPGSEGAWQQRDIVDALCRHGQRPPPGARVLIPLAHQYLNNENLGYLIAKFDCPLQVAGLPQEMRTPKQVVDWIEAVKPEYVVIVPDVPDPGLAPEFANIMKEETEKMIRRPDSGFTMFHRESLGATGKEYLIYRRF